MKFIKVKINSDGSMGRAYLPSQVNSSSTPPPGESYKDYVDKILWDEAVNLSIKHQEEINELNREVNHLHCMIERYGNYHENK